MIASATYDLAIGAIGYLIWSLLIIATFAWGAHRAYLRGCDDGWDQCVEELVIDADAADDIVKTHDDMVRSYVLPILQRRASTKDLPLHTLDAERLLKLLETSDRAQA